MFFTGSGLGQTVTGNCSGGKCLSFSSFSNCGSGIYKASMVQGTWDVARFKVYINGTRADLAGYTAGNNCNYDAFYDKNIITASNGGTNKTWYIKVNTNTSRIDLTTSNFTCSSCTNPSISSHPSTTNVSRCQGTSFPSLSVSASGSATLSYQWKSSTTSNGTYSNISGATSSSYTPPNNVVGTKYYKCTVTSSCNGSSVTSNVSGALTVTAPPTLGTINKSSVNFCASNGDFGAAVTVSGQTGTVLWDWGSNNGTWNNNWVTNNNSGTCCFPKKISTSDARADRIRYRVTNGSCPAVTSTTILIKNCYNEPPSSLAASSTSICSGTQITLTATFPNAVNMNGKVEFATTLNGAAFTSITPSANQTVFTANVTPSANTTYYVRYSGIASGGGSCYSTSQSVAISVTAPPSAGTLSGTQGICVGGSTTFSSTVSGGTWSSSNTSIAIINSSTGAITGLSAGTATMTYTKTGSGGCSNTTATRTVTVTAPPSAGTLSGTQAICLGGSTTFSSTVSGGTWSSSNTGIASINSSTGVISGVSAGTATMTYTKTGSGGCSNATATRTVTVAAPPSAGTLSGTQAICVSGSTTFSSTVSGGTWSSSNTGIATINSSTGAISGVSAGTATMTYTKTGSGGCSNATATRTVTVSATPTISSVSNGERCNSGTVDLSATASAGTINWYSAPTGGSSLATGTSFTTPSLSSTTTYYAEAINGSCVSSSRTAVTATVNTATAGPGGVTDELLVWLKADDANLGATWQDHSCNGHDYTTVNGPTLINNVWNDNPAIEILSGGFDAPVGAELGTDWTVFFVAAYKQGGSQGRLIDGHTGNYLLGFHGGVRNLTYWNGTANGFNSGIQTSSGTTDPHIYTYTRSNSDGNLKTRVDGDSLKTFTSTNSGAGIRLDINQGNYKNESSQARIGEFIIFNKALSNLEIQKVETYLATKYGVSASANDGGNGGDYISSNGTTYWDASSAANYHNDVVVIGKDNGTLAVQKQAKSYDDSLKVFVSGLASNNLANAGTITNDNAFIAIGHNRGRLQATTSSNSEKPNNVASRLEREWKITNTNFTNDFSIEIEWDSAGAVDLSHLVLLIDDDGDFSNANYYGSSDGLTFSFGSIIISGISSSFIPSGSTKFITLGSMDAQTPLPVELVSFEGKVIDQWTLLTWETSAEINNDYFILEKSNDAQNWTEITTVAGAGNSDVSINYSYLDKEGSGSICYYRLTQVDFDGKREVFKSIVVNKDNISKNEFLVFPNPISDMVQIKYNLIEDVNYNLNIYNSQGDVVYKGNLLGLKGENLAELNLIHLAPGSYSFVFTNNNINKTIIKVTKL